MLSKINKIPINFKMERWTYFIASVFVILVTMLVCSFEVCSLQVCTVVGFETKKIRVMNLICDCVINLWLYVVLELQYFAEENSWKQRA